MCRFVGCVLVFKLLFQIYVIFRSEVDEGTFTGMINSHAPRVERESSSDYMYVQNIPPMKNARKDER